ILAGARRRPQGMLGRVIAVTGALTCVLAVVFASAISAPAAATGRTSGINAQWLPPTTDPAARNLAFARIREVGVRLARIDSVWSSIERRRGSYDWSSLDAKVNELLAHGLTPLVILDYSNPLYSSQGAVAAGSPLGGGLPPFGIGAADYYPPDLLPRDRRPDRGGGWDPPSDRDRR